jgi:hypothetical protein
MKKILLVRAPGLSAGEAVRGDVAWTLSDLIAEGSFAALAEPPDWSALAGESGVEAVEIPYRDATSFDAALAEALRKAGDAPVAIVSEQVFVSRRFFPELRPGARLRAEDVLRLIRGMSG